MDTYLVTGGAGFIGGTFVRNLLAQKKARIVNFDALTYAGNVESLADVADDPNHIFVEGDITDGELVRSVLKEHQPQAVVHFAAESHVDRSIEGPRAFVQTNVMGTFELLNASYQYWKELSDFARGDFRFLQVSTDEVYGSLGDTGLFTETTPYQPNSPYSASKASADHFVRSYFHTFNLPTLTTNCSNNYGPFQFPEKLIPLMILHAKQGKPLPIYGDGKNIRDWLFVDDHCDAIYEVLQNGTPGEVYNIGGHCEKTNLEVVHTICDTVDRLCPGLPHGSCRELITFVQDRPGHDRRYAIDTTKIQNTLGWTPKESFESGLEKTVQWYLENTQWIERVQSGAYRGERLGLLKTSAS